MPNPLQISKRFLWGPVGIWPAVLTGYAILLPRELMIELMGAAFTPYRTAVIALFPLVCVRLMRYPVRVSLVDFAAAGAAFWIWLSLFSNEAVDKALLFGGASVADFLFSYLVGRATLRTSDQFRAFFILLLPGLGIASVVMAIESVGHVVFLRSSIAKVLGDPFLYSVPRIRLGLMRSSGPFPHPILGGVFLASILPLAWYVCRAFWIRISGCACAAAMIFSVSSAAFFAFLIGVALIAIYEFQKATKVPVLAICGLYLAGSILIASLIIEGGIVSVIIRYATLDPSTGYYRKLIWHFAGQEAIQNPFFGIGLRDWHRPVWMINDTIDAYWLVQSMRYGFPATIAIACMFVGSIYFLISGNRANGNGDQDIAAGISISLGTILFSGFTVHLWEGIAIWTLLLSGAAMSIGQQYQTVFNREWIKKKFYN